MSLKYEPASEPLTFPLTFLQGRKQGLWEVMPTYEVAGASGGFPEEEPYFPSVTQVSSPKPYASGFKNNHSTEMCSGSEEGSYLRRIDFCITQL